MWRVLHRVRALNRRIVITSILYEYPKDLCVRLQQLQNVSRGIPYYYYYYYYYLSGIRRR